MSQPWTSKASSFCSPASTGFLAFFCPCIIYGRTQHRLHVDPELKGYESMNGSCRGYGVAYSCCLQFSMQAAQRAEIREKYGLEGDAKNDGIRGFFCCWCDLVQQEKEVVARQSTVPLVTQQPGSQPAMQYGA